MKRGHYILIIIICIIILSWAFGGLYILFTDVQAVKTYELSDKANPPKSGTIEEFCIKYPEYCDATIEDKIRRIAKQENFPVDILYRLINCESQWDINAIGDYGKSYGLYQIHRGYHPEVSVEEARDVIKSTQWTIQRFKQGKWYWWTCARTNNLKY